MKTILELGAALRARKISPVEMTRNCLARIEALNPALNAFIRVTAKSALEQAAQAEKEIMRGEIRGPLHGIPIGLKDIVDTAGTPTTAASELYKDRIPAESAEVVRKLERAGAILLGKQNLHEFAYGGSSMISYFGEVHNPWNTGHITGGSSGGSAAAVAAGMGHGAIGTDTAGSIREPAALCGVVGLKPSYGRVSTQGVIPLSQSLDHVGPIGRTVTDVAVMLHGISAEDAGMGMHSLELLPSKLERQLRIGIPRSYFYDELDTEVATAVEDALRVMENLPGELRDVDLRPDTNRTLQAAEAYAFHADSVARTPTLYHPETLRRIKTGESVTREEYLRCRTELEAARKGAGKIFEAIDVFVTPTTPIVAPSIAELHQKPDLLRPRELQLLRNTRPLNVWGLPAISLPCGFTKTGLPIGLQIAGPPGREDVVLQAAHAYEQATDWHQREPGL